MYGDGKTVQLINSVAITILKIILRIKVES